MAKDRSLDELAHAAQHYSVRLDLRYDVGRYVSSEDSIGPDGKLIPHEQIPADKVKQGPQGFQIEVDMSTFEGPDGKQILYPDLESVIHAGYRLFGRVLRDRGII